MEKINKEDIIGLEQKYWDAMRQNNVDEAVALTKFPCIVSSIRGAKKISEDEYREMMSATDGTQFKNVEIENPEVAVVKDDTALIWYSTQMNGMQMLDVSTWVYENGRWACAFHSETPLQHPAEAS